MSLRCWRRRESMGSRCECRWGWSRGHTGQTKFKIPTLSQKDARGMGHPRETLRFGFCFEFDVAVGEFDGVFDILAVVLLAYLLGFLLNEGGKRIDVARYILASLLLGGNERVVKTLD